MNALHGEETANYEFPLIAKGGEQLIEILLNATTRRDASGNIVGVVGIGQNITEARAKRDAEMKQREAEAAQAAQASPGLVSSCRSSECLGQGSVTSAHAAAPSACGRRRGMR